jgi:hypothetical protein
VLPPIHLASSAIRLSTLLRPNASLDVLAAANWLCSISMCARLLLAPATTYSPRRLSRCLESRFKWIQRRQR